MELHFLIKGVILGFSIAAPVGPIGILCIRRTVQYGRWSGLFSGLGAAAADTLYGVVAAFGLSLISDLLVTYELWMRLGGGAFLILLGWRTFRSKATLLPGKVPHKTLLRDFFSTFFLTMTNPLTIISYLAIFAGLGLSDIASRHLDATALIVGVFLGSALWWAILSEGVTLFRKKVSVRVMSGINKVAGALITLFGLAAIASTF